jgi:murein DD-endopeptidase MepM/ murein hydrolase activator NlpD
VPPRRPTHGRHRRPKNTVAPAYLTVATVAAFAISGLNVPSAIGAAKDGRATASHKTRNQASSVKAAAVLRDRIARQDKTRVSRLRTDPAQALQAAQEAGRRARLAAEQARPRYVLPIQGYRLTAGFGEFGLWSHAHTGQDFAAPIGTPVHALADGTIVFASYDGAYGNKIAIQHAGTLVTWYAHLSAYKVKLGDKVKAGQLIGLVGDTGNTTGPHLHLEIRPTPDIPVDPLPWLRAHGIKY